MLLGIGVAVLLLVTIAYVTWHVRQCICTGPRMRKLERRLCKQAWSEDREDRARPTKPRVSQQDTPPPEPRNQNSDRTPSSAGSL